MNFNEEHEEVKQICPICKLEYTDFNLPEGCVGDCALPVIESFEYPAEKELNFDADGEGFDADDAYWDEMYGDESSVDYDLERDV